MFTNLLIKISACVSNSMSTSVYLHVYACPTGAYRVLRSCVCTHRVMWTPRWLRGSRIKQTARKIEHGCVFLCSHTLRPGQSEMSFNTAWRGRVIAFKHLFAHVASRRRKLYPYYTYTCMRLYMPLLPKVTFQI